MIGTVALAAIVAFSSGLGTKAAEEVGQSSGPPLTYSVFEESVECFSGTFLPGSAAHEVAAAPPPVNFEAIEERPDAMPAGRDDIQVAIQGESERKVTLTGIDFDVTRSPLPDGGVFYHPCGGPVVGRALQVDLDATPARVVGSSAEIDGMLEPQDSTHRLSRPIKFPWTVSVTDPLLLELIPTTERCYCTWTAEIPWVSGGLRGTIQIDDDGKPFRLVTPEGLVHYDVDFEGNWTATTAR